MKQAQAKHKLCRRLGYCIWNMAKCPSVKRPYPAGQQGKNGKKKKLSTYGEMLQEKQKIKAHYALTERQLRNIFLAAKRIEGRTDETLMRRIELRLTTAVLLRRSLRQNSLLSIAMSKSTEKSSTALPIF